jgi:Protein of unknown function (DUF5818)
MIRKRYAQVILIMVVLSISMVVANAVTPQTFTGTVSDTMCGAKHMLPGKTDAECTRECIKANGKYALVVDKHVYTLSGAQDDLSRLAGKRVRITGEATGDTIKVQSIVVAQQ